MARWIVSLPILWFAASVIAGKVRNVGGAANPFMPNGEPCIFPFEFQGTETWECVPFGGGGNWCRGEDRAWGPCMSFEPVAPDAKRKVVPKLAPAKVKSTTTNNVAYPVGSECCQKLAKIKFQSNLPVIIIDTDNSEIPDEPKAPAKMCTCGSEGNEFDGDIGIEIRGSTSARDFAKKSYAIKTLDAQGERDDVKLLGLPKESDWVLYGPEADKTLGFRNVLTYTFARAMGRYASRLKYFELFLVDNGKPLSKKHYAGLYLLVEKIGRGKNRINIAKNKGDDISGGYIFKYDNDNQDPGDNVFDTRLSTLQMILVYPKSFENPQKKEEMFWLKKYVDDFETALTTKKFNDPEESYKNFIDFGSFVDYFLVTEITKNPDGYRGSTYVHKDAEGPLVMGPVWDYNEAYGMCCGFPIEGYQQGGRSSGLSGGSAISPEGWRFSICAEPQRCRVDMLDGVSQWFRFIWQDKSFRKAASRRWTRLRAGSLIDENILAFVEEVKESVQSAALRNYARWKKPLGGTSSKRANLAIWDAEIQALQVWLIKHLAWMDEQLIKKPMKLKTPPKEEALNSNGDATGQTG